MYVYTGLDWIKPLHILSCSLLQLTWAYLDIVHNIRDAEFAEREGKKHLNIVM